jgi:GNAT superfamily N-acetyltransferase
MTSNVVIRRGTDRDVEACHALLWASVTDFGARSGTPLAGSAEDWWAGSESLARYLAANAAEWWVAEEPASKVLVGFARSIERGGLLELTEFFVSPAHQGAGIGRELITRAFPADRGNIRSIIATRDAKALARYYAAGTSIRFPIMTLAGAPRQTTVPDLTAHPISLGNDGDRDAMAAIELAVLGFARGQAEMSWLLGDRAGYLYRRGDDVIGFGFVGRNGVGPIAAMEAIDLPALLLLAEDAAVRLGLTELNFEVPGINEIAVRHLLERGFKFDPWVNFLMSNEPFGKFDRYVSFGPPVFL